MENELGFSTPPPSEPQPVPRGRSLWKWSLLATAVVFAFIIWRCSSAMITTARESDEAVGSFHQQLDREEYDAIFNEADPAFRNAGDKEQLFEFLTTVHNKLGAATSTNRNGLHVNTTTNGTFAIVPYDTKFAGGNGVETFTWRVEGGRLKLVGYHITSRELIVK